MLYRDLQKITERNPEQEVRGMAVPVLDACFRAFREHVPDDPIVSALRDVLSPEAIEEGEVRAVDAALVAGQRGRTWTGACPLLCLTLSASGTPRPRRLRARVARLDSPRRSHPRGPWPGPRTREGATSEGSSRQGLCRQDQRQEVAITAHTSRRTSRQYHDPARRRIARLSHPIERPTERTSTRPRRASLARVGVGAPAEDLSARRGPTR